MKSPTLTKIALDGSKRVYVKHAAAIPASLSRFPWPFLHFVKFRGIRLADGRRAIVRAKGRLSPESRKGIALILSRRAGHCNWGDSVQ